MRMHKGRFSEFISRIVADELTEPQHKAHPSDDLLLDDLSFSLNAERRSALAAHLVICAACRLRRSLLSNEIISASSESAVARHAPGLLAAARSQHRPRTWASWRELSASFRGTLSWTYLRPAFVLAATAAGSAFIALSLAVPLLRPFIASDSEVLDGLRVQLTQLEQEIASLPDAILGGSFGWEFPSSLARPTALANPEDIVVASLGLNDPTQRALYVLTGMHSSGLLDPYGLRWDVLGLYGASKGQSWADIAASTLGDPDLWPVMWVLNPDVASPWDEMPEDVEVRFPHRSRTR